ncbi:membrane protein [Tatumella morbirosei]|uniref:Membrane protein n=1 Tax=Tatumella morbirosei TaxID=642227 RepID=A0A095VZU7_9GAMM|nr:membrane protein [Tatumella morbirosei]KGD80240.1 membrane protein [Tatumella morbirosei]
MLKRLLQLYLGLTLYGISCGMYMHTGLGADPWDVFHLGVAQTLSANVGTVMIVTGALVLLLWIPLRQRPGLGTLSNVVVLGLAAAAALAVMPPLTSLTARWLMLAAAIVLNAIATVMYICAGFGPGPRDGLMTGLHRRTGWSLRLIRTSIEVTVLLIGWALGGNFGPGTIIYALAIGPMIQFFLPWFGRGRHLISPQPNKQAAMVVSDAEKTP